MTSYVKGEIIRAIPEYEVCRITFDADDRRWVATFRMYARSPKLQGAVTLVLTSVVDVLDGEIRRPNQHEEEEIIRMALRKIEEEAEFRAW
jgi:hypothetical protein